MPAPLHAALAGQFPEATWLLLPHKAGAIAADASQTVFENLGRATAMLVGPGFGLAHTSADFIEELLCGSVEHQRLEKHAAKTQSGKPLSELPPLVVDADGLKLLAQCRWTGPSACPPPPCSPPTPARCRCSPG